MSRRRGRTTTGRFGARYGGAVRKLISQTETEGKQRHECLKCGSIAVEKKSIGVWRCRDCGSTFAGGAYVPVTKVGMVARRSIRQA